MRMGKNWVREYSKRMGCKVALVRWRRVVRNGSHIQVYEEDDEMPEICWQALMVRGRAPAKVGEYEP